MARKMSITGMKKNRIYIALAFFILLVNVLPRFIEKKGPPDSIKAEPVEFEENISRSNLDTSLFVDFEEARKRAKKIEDMSENNRPLYLFYGAINLLVAFIFFLGLVMAGYFIFSLFKKRDIFRKTHNRAPPRWRIGEVFKIIILALTFSYIFFMMIAFLAGLLQSATGSRPAFLDNDNFRMIFDTIVLDFIVFLVILGFLWKIHGKKLASLGIAKEGLARNILYGVGGYITVLPVIFTIGVLVYILLNIIKLTPPPQPIVGLFLMEKNVALVLVSGVIASIFGPVIEEIFFRGVMYNAVKRKFGIFWGIVITSVLFSFLHTHAFSYFLVGFIPIAILGGVLAYLYEKTGSLVPSITLHVLNNVGSVVMVLLFKYFNSLVT